MLDKLSELEVVAGALYKAIFDPENGVLSLEHIYSWRDNF